MFTIEFLDKAEKAIKKLDATTYQRIKTKCEKLCMDPFPPEVERVEGYGKEKYFGKGLEILEFFTS